MPSPLAHGSIYLIVRAVAVRHSGLRQLVGKHPRFFALVCFALLWGADTDFALRALVDHPLLVHGGATHSLVAGALLALCFYGACRWRAGPGLPFFPVLGLGLAAAWSHVLMDLATWGGRGIMVFWPFTTERFLVPPIFFGVHRSEPLAWKLHLATLVTELLFCYLVWRLGRWGQRSASQRSRPLPVDHRKAGDAPVRARF